jgi:hypothetical protein
MFKRKYIMQYKLTKQIWLQAAKKAGWFKKIKIAESNQEEIIEIGGKYYIERDGDIIEVPSPKSEPNSISVSTKYGNMTFTEGEVVENFFGKYRILSLNPNNTMTVEYIEIKNPSVRIGEQKTYPITSQAESIFKEQKTQAAAIKYKEINFGGSKDFFTIGFLAKNGRIRVEVPITLKQQFDQMYKKFTGEDPSKFLGHGYAAELNPETKGNSWELRISFPNPGPEILNNMSFSNYPIVSSANRLEINYSNYVLNLFKLGFTIGTNELNIPKIMNAIQNSEEKNSFIQGTKVIDVME